MESDRRTCSHAGCKCTLEADASAESQPEKHGQVYCSPGCAEGEGCRHSACNCAFYETSL